MQAIHKSFLTLFAISAVVLSCHKKNDDIVFIPKKIVYLVKGTKMRLNFIDSNSAFQSNQVYTDSFRYEFTKGPGAGIGISVHPDQISDSIFYWTLTIDGKLYANAFSEGGAYLTVPY